MLEATGGGVLVNPLDPPDLARGLAELLTNSEQRFELAKRGHAAVRARFDPGTMAAATVKVLEG